METETVNLTARFKLRDPSDRKREKLDRVIAEQRAFAQLVAERMPGVQRYQWGNIRNTGILRRWVHDFVDDTDLYLHDLYHGVGRDVAANFLAAQEKNEPLPSPDSYADRSHIVKCDCTPCTDSLLYEENDGAWGVRVSLHKPWQEGRVWFRILAGQYQREILQAIRNDEMKKGKVEIHRKDGAYYLHQSYSYEVPVHEDSEVDYVAGVNLGLKNIATLVVKGPGGVADVEFFAGDEVRHHRERLSETRQELREAGRDDKADQVLDRVHLFVENRNHVISRRIVDAVAACGPAKIVLEDLTGSQEAFVRRENAAYNDQPVLENWPFRELQSMIEYKARDAGIPVVYVDPRNAGQCCNRCGESGERNGDNFRCVDCDYEVNADFNGAMNIASRA